MAKIAFTGDVAFSKYFASSCNDENLLGDEVKSFLSESDYTVVNIEAAIGSNNPTVKKALLHTNPAQSVEWLRKINGNIWSLSNNHILDCGIEGLESTIAAAREENAATIGAGKTSEEAEKPVIIEKDGGIGIFAVTYYKEYKADKNTPGCILWDDIERIKRAISKIKMKNRYCVVVAHGGEEFSNYPLPRARKLFRKYLALGADVVVAHHPHVAQGYETVGEKVIFYSLGNFIFDTDYQRAQKYTDRGILIKLDFSQKGITWEHMSLLIDRENHRVVKGEELAIFRNITSREHSLLWPLAARDTCLNHRIAFSFVRGNIINYTPLQWFFKREIKKLNRKEGRYTMLGRFLCLFGLWKLCDKEIVEYLRKRP